MAIYIGTSGFSYHHWTDKFYPSDIRQSEWLSHYSKFFNTVELNVSFYRLPSENAFKKWHDETPPDFKFALKGSRYITHIKRLQVENDTSFSVGTVETPGVKGIQTPGVRPTEKLAKSSVEVFMERAALLGNKLRVILWQLPPGFKEDSERLKSFLKLLRKYHEKYRFAFEFRHESWFQDEIYEILRENNAALVISDSSHFPKSEIQTADFSYIRFHGGTELYTSEYSYEELKKWAKKIEKWSGSRDVYAYFNNDANAFAVKNALELRKLLGEK